MTDIFYVFHYEMSCLYISLFWKAKQDNLDLTGKVSILKQEYDDRHETMTNELQAASDDLVKTKMELAQLRLKNAQDREIAYAEMHKLANTMVENKQQQKDAKDLELELRQRLTSYDEKFTSLHSSLEATNSGYTTFTGHTYKYDFHWCLKYIIKILSSTYK